MGRSTLFSFLFTLSVSQLWAQSGGFANLEFTENKGQWDSQVKFRAQMSAGTLFLQQKGFTVQLDDTTDLRYFSNLTHLHGKSLSAKAVSRYANLPGNPGGGGGTGGGPIIHSHAYRMTFVNANEAALIIPDKPLPSYSNYIKGNDPSKWGGNCRIFTGVTYKDLYPGIDLRYYSDRGRLKYDLIIHPGADPGQIAMKYEGQDQLALKKEQMIIKTSVGDVRELSPYSYQPDDAGKKEVECRYTISDDHTVRFRLSGYDKSSTLVIDPVIVFCTFTGSTTDNWGFTATYGPDGSMYAAGIVHGSGWPVSVGAFQSGTSSGGGRDYWDVGVIKFSSNGSTRLYATYLGGNGNEYPHSLVCDNNGQLVILGRTYSSNFPQTNTAYQGNNPPAAGGNGGYSAADIFVTKLNASGTGLIGSMRIGGSANDGVNITDQGDSSLMRPGYNPEHLNSLVRNYGDWSRSEVILDAQSNIYVASVTQSSDFPIVGNGFQKTFKGGGPNNQDAVLIKMDPTCNNIQFSTFLGGSKEDAALVMDINPLTNDIYVGGSTLSPDFPGMSGNSAQGAFQGTIAGFVSIIGNNGSTATLKGSTFLSSGSGGSIDMIYGVKLDKTGNPYAMGTSTGQWQPNGVTYYNSGAKQFVVKLKPDLSGIQYTTVFGTSSPKPNMSPVAFLVDRCENVYISGWGGWYTSPFQETDPYYLQGVQGMPTTPDAIKPVCTDNRDFYFIVLQKNSSKLLYGTFYGEQDDNNSISEHVDGGTSRYDKNGIIYQAICANCYRGDPNAQDYLQFPTTPGVWSRLNGSGDLGCNLAALKIAFNFSGVSAGLKTTLKGRGDSLGCVPLQVTLQDTVRNAVSYKWDFGDGSPAVTTTSYIQQHTYSNVGNYTVTLIAFDPNSCNGSDTVTKVITARNDEAKVNFKYGRPPGVPCTSMEYLFTNLSEPPTTVNKPFGNQSFQWNFGDGSAPPPLMGLNPPLVYSYQSSGTYNVSLILVDTNYCNAPDTVNKLLFVAQNVKASFVTPANGCAPYYAVFNNTSIAGQTFYWDFGDGSPIDSLDRTPPPHLYQIGTYTIKLKVVDSTTCNIADSTTFTITVHEKPTAAFSFQPAPPVPNTPDVFTNQSTGGVQYKWLFGDGDSTIKTTMDTVMHQYNATGTFNACLITFNQYGCTDTACQQVPVLINPLLDVPNAFTPGRFGQNSIIKVVGFGITKMTWRIYNRWGHLVFQSNSPSYGWDGNYNGKPQPMDVYAYTLEAEYFDGKRATKKGDITLLR